MTRARNPISFRPIEQLGLPLGAHDASDAELSNNIELFEAYFAYRRAARRPASLETLHKDRMQWGALCKWFAKERLRADQATETTFNTFFASPLRADNHIRNKKSYLRLYDRVMYCAALAARQAMRPAVALPAPFDDESPGEEHRDRQPLAVDDELGPLVWNRVAYQMMQSAPFRLADMVENKRPTVFLTEADDQKLRYFLYNIPEQGSLSDLRTFVLMALIRGSGASPGEIRTLQLDEIDRDGQGRAIRLRMYGRSGNQGHVYALEDYALRALNYWLAFNLSPKVDDSIVRGFPEVTHATEAKQVRYVFPNLYHTAERYGQAIDGDTATRAVRAQLYKLGIFARGSITQMLRTQFATMSLRDGVSPEQVVERMGYYDTRSVLSYLAIAHGDCGIGNQFHRPVAVTNRTQRARKLA